MVCALCTDLVWRGTLLLLVPVMLGREALVSDYFDTVKHLFHLPQSLGAIGGKKRSALYFIGSQGDSLLYLDPHYVQKASKSRQHLEKHIATYQSQTFGTLPLNETDSSITFAFYFDSAQSFNDFQTDIEENRSVLKGAVFSRKSSPLYLTKSVEVDVLSDFIEIS